MSKRLRSSDVCADCNGPGESHWPGPLPSALLTRTPARGPPPWVGRVPAAKPHTPHPRSRQEGIGAALRQEPSGPVRAGRTGGRRPPVPLVRLFPVVSSVPGRVGRRPAPGWGHFNRKGLGQSAGRSITEVKCKRPPDCGPQRLQVSPSSLPHRYLEPRSARGPYPGWAAFAACLHADAPKDP